MEKSELYHGDTHFFCDYGYTSIAQYYYGTKEKQEEVEMDNIAA